MKKVLLIILIFSGLRTFAQTDTKDQLEKNVKSLSDDIKSLKLENIRLKAEIATFNSKQSQISSKLDSVRLKETANAVSINSIIQQSNDLGIKIKQTGKTSDQKISAVNQSLSHKSLYGIIGVLLAILLSGILYWILRKKQQTDKSIFEDQISKTKQSISEEQIIVNTRLAELYNGQMEVLKIERNSNPNPHSIDHALPLKVADEIVKMQMNLLHMDSKIKGHKQLSIAVTNVFDNFKANGYEIIDLLNKPYNDGMNMQATMEPDASLKEGEQIIRRIIKPEVHFNNKIIQHAQVFVSYGE
jgi:hypothetical protein